MTSSRSLEILSHDFDIPVDFYPIPLEGHLDLDSARWAQWVAEEVRSEAIDPGDPGDIVEALAEIRTRLIGQKNPGLTAAISVRPQIQFRIGSLLISQQLTMEDDDGPDSFEHLMREYSTRMRPGARSRDLELWRDAIPAGQMVGMFQRVEFLDLGEDTGRLAERTVFGIFPDDSRDMIEMTFSSEDFGAFDDMRVETQAIASTLRVQTGAA